MPKQLLERVSFAESATKPSADGRFTVQAISAGLGSSGYYSPEVLEAAANDKLIDQGTFLFVDHASESERTDRPERSVREIAGVFTGAATYDKTKKALVGEVQIFEQWREQITEMAPWIGLSISGSATDVVEGEVDGRRVSIIEGLARIDSVDFVTRAGRGGRVLLECAKPSEVLERAIGHGVAEATADERRTQLSDAVRTAYAGNDRYAWVQDFDDTTVWFQASAENERSRTWQQAYTVADDDMSVSLTGERTEVRPVTKYVPVTPTTVSVTRPDSTTTTTESEEDTMPKIQIEESEHRSLLEKAGRVETLESERDTLKAENTKLKEDAARDQRRGAAREIVEASDGVFDELQVAGLLADLPVKEGSDDLDVDAFTLTVAEAAAKQKAAAGAGRVGFGGNTDTPANQTATESAAPRTSAWGRPINESQKGA